MDNSSSYKFGGNDFLEVATIDDDGKTSRSFLMICKISTVCETPGVDYAPTPGAKAYIFMDDDVCFATSETMDALWEKLTPVIVYWKPQSRVEG